MFLKKNHREQDRRKRLQISQNGDRLDSEFSNGGEVEKAPDTGIDKTKNKERQQVRALQIKVQTLLIHHIDEYC